MKLYQMFLKKIGLWKEAPEVQEPSQEEKIYNPIGCKIGSIVKIDVLDFRGTNFKVKEIKEYDTEVNSNTYKMVDYVLVGTSKDLKRMDCKLRIAPYSDDNSNVAYKTLLLTLYDDSAYNEELHTAVQDESKEFKIDYDDVHEKFWRVNDVGISYKSTVKAMTDENNDGRVDQEEVVESDIEYWDYYRNTDVEGVTETEFFFVEMNSSDGWFQIWRGFEVSSERVEIF